MEEAQEPKTGKYCPVCEKVYREGLDFCPVHPTVLMIRSRDWGEGFKIFETKAYDESDDDFLMDEGLVLVQHPNPLIAEWRRRHPQ